MDNGQLERISVCLVFGSGCNGIVLLVLCSSLSSYYLMVLMRVLIVFHARRTVLGLLFFNVYRKIP